MRVLGIDTSTAVANIAIIDDDRVLVALDTARSRSADLLVEIDAAFAVAKLAPGAVDAVAIGAGPGSFTGLRIGMATAKGIAFAAGKPLWAVSSLRALAHEAPHRPVCAVLDARKGEVFAGCYAVGGALIGNEHVMAPAALAGWASDLIGPDAIYCGDALPTYPDLAPLADRWRSPRTPSGLAVAALALAGPRIDVLTSGAPVYIRPSEAEVNYPDGVPGALRRH